MKSQTLEFKVCDSSIGYHARKVTLGPESDLVKAFLESGLEGKGYSFTSERMAIFIEPKIESGFPDVVIAKFKPGFYDQWPKARNLLTSNELRMLSFLYSCQGADYDKIRASMHLNSVSAANSIELLFDANLIDRNRESRIWEPKSLEQTYGITSLVAIEAKTCNNSEVLEQASLNRWFASESYTLTPVAPTTEFKLRARRAGVGMVSATRDNRFHRCLCAKQYELPSSYASWHFNEWIGRRLTLGAKA